MGKDDNRLGGLGGDDSRAQGAPGDENDEKVGRGFFGRRAFLKGAAVGAGVAATNLSFLGDIAAGAPNPVSVENARPGSPPEEWEYYIDDSIVGFASDFSMNAGETVRFKIKTTSTNYRVRIYRMGWYNGNGARRVAEVFPSAPLPQTQPAPAEDPATGLVDCGNWAVSASWAIPANAASGLYMANMELLGGSEITANRLWFVVRNDGRTSDVVYQTTDTTMYAYNRYGGNSLYYGFPIGRAYKISYNRPVWQIGDENDFFSTEIPLIRWMERNGYDVTYISGVDADRRPNDLLNRKVYITGGHDEYVSGAQRANIKAARDAGVSLMFLSGNEVFWKIRWEPSIDGTNTPYKTMVCYKESHADAKIDPSPEWTGTWRDPRFSPPSNGGLPENELTGQLFKAINRPEDPDFPITVPASYKSLRFWRNTSIPSLQAGQVRTLAENTLGVEWDCDVDNGFRPAGLIRMSQTTATVPESLQDNSKTYISESLTHHLTLYRAASGALVFGTGTLQWAYGLDEYHIRWPSTENRDMQQATLNVLADMGVQPATKQSNLTSASASTDHVPPVSTITGPATGATVPVGSPVTVTGTAVDTGGGVVAGIEVSTDGGTKWHPATGSTSWSYVFTPTALGPLTIRTRAVDDSCNLETPSAGRSITVGPRPTPCSIWGDAYAPQNPSIPDNSAIEVGVKFRAAIDGFISGIRFYKGAGNTGTHVGHLWTAAGSLLATANFAGETASGWQQASFTPVAVTAGSTYVVSYFAPAGHYAADSGYFATSAFDVWPLRALASGEDGPNGIYRYGSTGFPTSSYGASNYWVDVVFDVTDNLAPGVVDRSPAPNIELVALNSTVKATFSEAMNAGSIQVTLATSGGTAVPSTSSYDAPSRTVTLTPSASLTSQTSYVATVVAAQDASGQGLAAPVSWSFATTGPVGSLPTGMWDSSATPANPLIDDPSPVELGVKFKVDIDGEISAIRFHKAPGSSGTHVGHLWTAAGTLLATVPFANETTSGWQQVNLPAPVPVQRNAVYVASYHAPNGRYGATGGTFASAGVDRGAIHGVWSQAGYGPNGVYAYGASAFPTSSWGSSNYFVDVVFRTPPDVSGPTVTNQVPAPGLLSVSRTAPVTARFSEAVNQGSIQFTVRDSGNNPVAGTVAYDGPSTTASFTPTAALGVGATYTASVQATDTTGNAMPAPVTWSFTTVVTPGGSPATLWDSGAMPTAPDAGDTSAIEVGTKFRVDRAAGISGIRFYKSDANVGPHVGRLWRIDGTLLGSVSFTAETAAGWQQAMFGSPIPVSPGVTYVASYHAPNGHYAASSGGFSSGVDSPPLHALANGGDGPNGVYAYGPGGFPTSSYGSSNYWVDVIFVDTSGPAVVDRTPGAGAVGVGLQANVTATFDEAVVPGSISFQLRDQQGVLVAAATSYDAGSRTVTLNPTDSLAAQATYTATVSGATDTAGNPMAGPVSWSFTTQGGGTLTVFGESAPATPNAGDPSAIELGMKFRTDVAGTVSGVRYYKSTANTGTHRGRLWSASGQLLGETTFGGETPSGWQYAAFSSPVAVAPNTTYVVSYHTPSGGYSATGSQFFGQGVDNGPLHALASGADGGNGVYLYGNGGFPTGTYASTNYWVDVVFVPGP